MSKSIARWIDYDVESMAGTTTLRVFLDGSGGLEKTAAGIRIKATGVTNAMLTGSIGLDKLIKSVIAADGTVDFTGDQSMGSNKLTNLAQASASTDAVTLAQLQAAVSGLDFQADVLNTQTDATLDPGTPNTGDRYTITDAAALHANFGTITGVANGDIVQYDGADFVVSYDVSVEGAGAIAWDTANNTFMMWDGTVWAEFGGLAGVTAGDGIDKAGNVISVDSSDIVGAGLEDDGANNIRISAAAAGSGLTGGAGSALSVTPDSTTGGDTAPVSVGVNGVGIDVTDLDGDHLQVDFTPANYVPSVVPAEADSVDDLAAHLKGIDSALSTAGSGSQKCEYVEITAGMVSAGYFTLTATPEAADLVFVTPIGGVRQVNKQSIGIIAVAADFDVLGSGVDEVHINNTGLASALSDIFVAGDILMVEYTSA